MKFRTHRFHVATTAISIVLAIIVGCSLAFLMNDGIKLLPIRQYFDPHQTNSVWDWSNVTNHSDQELRETANFLYLHQINTVFVDMGVCADIMQIKDSVERQRQEQKLANHVQRYIQAMQAHDIRVFAAAGHTTWSKPEYQHIPLAIQQFVFDFNQQHTDKLAGLEFDIEAYNQEHFEEASFTEKELVLNEFMDMLDRITAKQATYTKQTNDNLELGFAIPYWFDNQNQNIRSITWHDKTGPVLFHILDRLAVLPRANIVVMAYRNAASGNDGMIYHSRTEVEYAQANTPRVAVLMGVEVNDVEPAKITFYDQTYVQLSSEIKHVNAEYRTKKAYQGIAINDLAGYHAMESGSETPNEDLR